MKVGFIGCGNMGGALARAVSKVDGVEIHLYDKDTEKAASLAREIGATVGDMASVVASDYLFLGVKPNMVGAVLGEASPLIDKSTVIISMAAGVAIEKIESALGRPEVGIIRIMPNTPVAYGEGMILYSVSGRAVDREAGFLTIMKYAGTLDKIPEALIDAGSAVSGCGPAFVYMFIEALADGGVAAGLPRDKAMLYAMRTVLGAATMALESGKHPAELKDMVCSPGGSTIEGVLALEDGGMRGVVADAVIAAFEKTKLLGK